MNTSPGENPDPLGAPVPDAAIADGAPGGGPLTDGPLTDGPLTDGPLTDGPLTEGPLTEGSPGGGPLSDGPPGGAADGGRRADPRIAAAQARCAEATRRAEEGETLRAAELFQDVLAMGEVPQRARAALGLAVVREDMGDVRGAREADLIAIGTGDPEYGPRAAYHLALSYERAGERADAAASWRRVVEFGNPAYLPPAQLALAQIAHEDGDIPAAKAWWERVVASGDKQYGPVAAHDLAQRLLADGETARAQRLLSEVLRGLDPDAEPYAYSRLAIAMGLAHLDQAVGAFTAALGVAQDDVAPLAVELLARTLPLRGRGLQAREVWEGGLADPAISDQVRERLRRDFGDIDPAAEGLWWEPYVEEAVTDGTVPALAGELFGALDHLYSVVALRHAEGPGRLSDDAYTVLREAVAVPEEYPWGGRLRESFTERLREAVESAASPDIQS
jgi:tetratricopeptide (TPR) repeat protein